MEDDGKHNMRPGKMFNKMLFFFLLPITATKARPSNILEAHAGSTENRYASPVRVIYRKYYLNRSWLSNLWMIGAGAFAYSYLAQQPTIRRLDIY